MGADRENVFEWRSARGTNEMLSITIHGTQAVSPSESLYESPDWAPSVAHWRQCRVLTVSRHSNGGANNFQSPHIVNNAPQDAPVGSCVECQIYDDDITVII